LIAAIEVLQVPGYEKPLTDKEIAGYGWFLILLFIAVVVGLHYWGKARQKRKYLKARRDAHNPIMPNIHGGSREASKEDAKAKGWLK
jgi:hypothetical protein